MIGTVLKRAVFVSRVSIDSVCLTDGLDSIEIDGEPEQVLSMLVKLDGSLSSSEVALECARDFDIAEAEIAGVLASLDEAGYLASADAVIDWSGDYSRQHSYFSLGARGLSAVAEAQRRISQSRVLFLGVGGIGCQMLDLMIRAGVRHVVLVDGDKVERSNLNRQLLYDRSDVGHLKVDAAAQRVGEIAEDVVIDSVPRAVGSAQDIRSLAQNVTFAVVSADTPLGLANQWANDALVSLGIPFIMAGYVGRTGLVGPLVVPGVTPCLACDENEARLRVDSRVSSDAQAALKQLEARSIAPSMGPFCASAASLAARDALMFIAGLENPSTVGSAVLLDSGSGSLLHQDLRVTRVCPICGNRPS